MGIRTILALGTFAFFAGMYRWHTNLFAAIVAVETDLVNWLLIV